MIRHIWWGTAVCAGGRG